MRVRGEKSTGRGFAGAWKRNWKRIAAGILVVVLFSNEMSWSNIMVIADEVGTESAEPEDGGGV
jgi:hypothetical protein